MKSITTHDDFDRKIGHTGLNRKAMEPNIRLRAATLDL